MATMPHSTHLGRQAYITITALQYFNMLYNTSLMCYPAQSPVNRANLPCFSMQVQTKARVKLQAVVHIAGSLARRSAP